MMRFISRSKRMWLSVIALSIPFTVFQSSVAQAQDAYPNKPIKFVVPYPPGGVSDNSSRAIADRLGKELGANMVVENKAGAASTVQQLCRSLGTGRLHTLRSACLDCH